MTNLNPAMQQRLDKWRKQAPLTAMKRGNPIPIRPAQMFVARKKDHGDDHENFHVKEKK